MTIPLQRPRPRSRLHVAALARPLRHIALLVAVLGTVFVTVRFGPSVHAAHAQSEFAANLDAMHAGNSATNSLDGRLPDGAPSVVADAGVLTVVSSAATVATPTANVATSTPATPAPKAVVTTAPSTPVATAAAAVVKPEPARETALPALSRITATPTPAPEPVVRAAAAVPVASRYASLGEMNTALGQTPWPAALWPSVTSIALCEAGLDTDRDGRYDTVDTQASGAGGRYIGVMQIGVDHSFSKSYDLRSLVGNLSAAYELWSAAGGSFGPWGCR